MAVSLDYGQCANCSESNPKSISTCRSCGGALPWAKQAKPASSGGGGFSMGDVDWGPMALQIFGGLVFCAGVFLWFGNVIGFFPTFSGCGYIVGAVGGMIWKFASGGE